MARVLAAGRAYKYGQTVKRPTKTPSYAVSTPAARGIPTQYGQSGYIGRETAFGAGGGIQPFTRTFQTPQQVQAMRGPQYGGLIRQVGAQQREAKAANIARQKRIESLYGEMMGMVSPGGAFEKRGLADIERQKTKGVGKEMQQMISSGMYGTTTAAGVGRGWEAEVGAPARLRLEDIMQQRQLGVMGQKAGFLERIEDVYPDYSSLLQLLAR